LTNVLWVEQPVGTGFSIGDVTATSEEDIAADFVKFFQNFQEIFGIKNFKIYVTGESYAGRYVPYIANAMLDMDNTTYFNLKGAMTYDPCIGSYVYTNNAFINKFVHDNNNVLGFNDSFIAMLDDMHQSCGYADFIDQYLAYPPNGTQPPKYFNTTSEADCDTWVCFRGT
jgi:carboxypeptidase D